MTLASEQLVQILPLSLLIGVSAGLLTALATKRLGMQHQSRAYAELSLLLVTALLTYTLTDEVALSEQLTTSSVPYSEPASEAGGAAASAEAPDKNSSSKHDEAGGEEAVERDLAVVAPAPLSRV